MESFGYLLLRDWLLVYWFIIFLSNNEKNTKFNYPIEKYLNVVKRGYLDCKLDKKYLFKALIYSRNKSKTFTYPYDKVLT